MVGFASLGSFLIYNAFFRGIYNFRTKEIVNMRNVPFALKFGISVAIGFGIARDVHMKAMYDPDLYRVAIKYRTYYDPAFEKFQQENETNVAQDKVETTT